MSVSVNTDRFDYSHMSEQTPYCPPIDWQYPPSLRPPHKALIFQWSFWLSIAIALSLHLGLAWILWYSPSPSKRSAPTAPSSTSPVYAYVIENPTPEQQPPEEVQPPEPPVQTQDAPTTMLRPELKEQRFDSSSTRLKAQADPVKETSDSTSQTEEPALSPNSRAPDSRAPDMSTEAASIAAQTLSSKRALLQKALHRLANKSHVDETDVAQALSFLPYPESARRAGLEGTVVVYLTFTPQGQIDQMLISRSSGHALLDQAALDALRLLPTFSHSPKELLIPVEFSLRP